MLTIVLVSVILSACSVTVIKDEVTNFEECVEAGNPVMESYPRQCKAGDEVFTEEINNPIACTMDAKQCPDGSYVGRAAPDCDFEDCPESGKTFCTKEQRGAEICTLEYRPVCGWNDKTVQCIKFPCAQTYSNPCQACAVKHVEYYTEGKCPQE